MGATNKAKRKQPVAKSKANTPSKTIDLPDPGTDDPDEAMRSLARNVPGWDDLSETEQEELTRLVRAFRKRGDPARVKMTRKPDGGWSIAPHGKSELLAASSCMTPSLPARSIR